jgi:hypothetical protein
MSQLDLGDYESKIQNLATTLQSVENRKEEVFKHKETANEILKTIGEAKTYLSGRNILKYAYGRGKQFIKDAADKAGVKAPEGFDEAETGNLADAAEQASQYDNALDPAFDYGEVSLETPVAQESLYDNALDMGRGMGSGELENNYGEISEFGGGGDGFSQVHGTLDRGEIEDAEQAAPTESNYIDDARLGTDPLGEEADAAASRATIGLGRAAGREVGEGVGKAVGDAAGEETATALDFVPGLEAVGLVAGLGLTIAEAIKKPHDNPVVDKINVAQQAGL